MPVSGQDSERVVRRHLIKFWFIYSLHTTYVSYLYSHFNNRHRPVDVDVTMTIISTLMSICEDLMAYGCWGNKTKYPFHSIINYNTIYVSPSTYPTYWNFPDAFFINRYIYDIPVNLLLYTLTQNAFVGKTHSYTIIYITYYWRAVNPLSSTTVYTSGYRFPSHFYSRLRVLLKVFTLIFVCLNYYEDRKSTYNLFNFICYEIPGVSHQWAFLPPIKSIQNNVKCT